MNTEFGTPDPRVRSYLPPTRVVWTSGHGVAGATNMLAPDDSACTLSPDGGERPALLVDFGREVHGGVRFELPPGPKRGPVRVRVRFGESVTEAMSQPDQDHAIHDTELLLPWYGHIEFGQTGFRFVRVDLLDPTPVAITAMRAVCIYRPLEWIGSFRASDARLEEIWRTGAYTVHLCMQDHVWDGIKRDRLVWIGDLHPETMVAATVFGEATVVEESLDYVRDRTPLPEWMNGISSYSLWWVLCHYDWFRYHGNRAYLSEQRGYLVDLLARIGEHVDANGCEHLTGHRFLEWPTSEDPTAIDAGLQALVTLTLTRGAELCRVLGEEVAAGLAEQVARRAAACGRAPTASKQANALAVLAGTADATEINDRVLSRDPFRGLSTFYGYYVLQARAAAGDYRGALDLIRTYWGGMIDAGATTFWEHFELDWLENAGRIDELVPAGRADIHADRGAYCFQGLRHSFCHGWAAGPTAWLTEHVLGLAPAAPGFARLRVAPHLGDLEWAEGSIPTPHGVVSVSHKKRAGGEVETNVEAPPGIVLEGDARRNG